MSNRIVIFDTTMRDGEQSPGATMTIDEKIRIAEILDAMKVDIVEAGFPASGEDDFAAVRAVGHVLQYAKPCGLARARTADIDAVAEALKDARNGFRIHTFIGTSPVHREYKLDMTEDEVVAAVTASVARARSHTDDVEWSAEDATRTEPDFLIRCVQAAVAAGATTINIPDTVGYSTPHEYEALIRHIVSVVPENVVVSTHCHNDLGNATANSLAGARGGARQIECTINGIGERAGNAALEEVVMNIKVRPDAFPYEIGTDTRYIRDASETVTEITGFIVQRNKAVVGENAFRHTSGIHQHGMLQNTATYQIIEPADVGYDEGPQMILGKLSGRAAFVDKLDSMGIVLPDGEIDASFKAFKAIAAKRAVVSERDLAEMMETGGFITPAHAAQARGREAIRALG